jgi:hypothetical protein
MNKITKPEIIPLDLDEANYFVEQHHRHHKPVIGYKFALGLSDGESVVGCIIVGRPVSRILDTGWTLEATRCCSIGTQGYGCSLLYAAAWRATRALGYKQLITYTLKSEIGISLRAANWKCVGERGGGTWNRKERLRIDKHPLQTKMLWEAAQ